MDHMRRCSVEKPSKRTWLQFDGLDERGVAQRVGCGGASADGRAAGDFSGADDGDVAGVDGVDEADVAGDPLAFPSDLGDGIVGEIG